MSHNLLFVSYVNGELAPYDLSELRSILLKHGAEVGGPHDIGHKGFQRYWVTFPANEDGDEISDDESGIYTTSAGVNEFAIGHPIYGDRLKRLAFEILQSLNVCMHPDVGDEVFSAHSEARHLPHVAAGRLCNPAAVCI